MLLYSRKQCCLKPNAFMVCSVSRAHFNCTMGSCSPRKNDQVRLMTVYFFIPWHCRMGRLIFWSPDTSAYLYERNIFERFSRLVQKLTVGNEVDSGSHVDSAKTPASLWGEVSAEEQSKLWPIAIGQVTLTGMQCYGTTPNNKESNT
jgi:hypothetical protein